MKLFVAACVLFVAFLAQGQTNKISMLPVTTTISNADFILINQTNPASPTGYTTRTINYSNFSLPFLTTNSLTNLQFYAHDYCTQFANGGSKSIIPFGIVSTLGFQQNVQAVNWDFSGEPFAQAAQKSGGFTNLTFSEWIVTTNAGIVPLGFIWKISTNSVAGTYEPTTTVNFPVSAGTNIYKVSSTLSVPYRLATNICAFEIYSYCVTSQTNVWCFGSASITNSP